MIAPPARGSDLRRQRLHRERHVLRVRRGLLDAVSDARAGIAEAFDISGADPLRQHGQRRDVA